MRISFVTLGFLLIAACSKPQASPPATSPEPGADGLGDGNAASEPRPELTADACEAEGGRVVGDIGDGAIHRADYRCPDSGEAPIGSIVAEPDGPMGVEGAVCCR